jgi:hypothetical protein
VTPPSTAEQAQPVTTPLAAPAFTPLPLGAVTPAGWLARQLRIQADGLTGHLDLFWPDVAQSQWFGGTAEGWERAPYWLDGAIPLAWLLDDAPMKARITRYVNHIVAHRLERDWQGTTEVDLHLPMRPTVTTRYNGAVAVERGPLVYALRVGEEWTRVNADKPHRELPHADFEVRPTTPWNVGLVIDPARPDARLQFEERPVGAVPFSPDGAGVVATAEARRLPDWKLVDGWAGEISPPDAAWADPSRVVTEAPVERITLIPYGCTNIRVTEFPRLHK